VELGRARSASEEGSPDTKDALEDEFGDLLFTVVTAVDKPLYLIPVGRK